MGVFHGEAIINWTVHLSSAVFTQMLGSVGQYFYNVKLVDYDPYCNLVYFSLILTDIYVDTMGNLCKFYFPLQSLTAV